jgi:hypothetical protein
MAVQAARILDYRGNIESAEVHRRVLEFRRLLEDQRQLIEESNQRGYDATSAQIIFESLVISFSLCAQGLRQSAA